MNKNSVIETRVRGVLTTPSGQLLLIKRVRANVAPYWVFPGGGVEDSDSDVESALMREIREELGGTATIKKLLYILERAKGPDTVSRELFFLATVDRWDEADRSGPEFKQADSGQYIYDEFPISYEEILARDIKPSEVKQWLLANHLHLRDLPDLRS